MTDNRLNRRSRWLLAFTATEMLAVATIVTSIPVGAYARAQQKALELKCVNNLQQIGKAILMYQTGEGKLPEAAFYPDKPFADPRSIVKMLEDSGSGIPREMWVCPGVPSEIGERGLTFVYNDTLGGRQSLPHPEKAWLLIEVNCVSKKVSHPHPMGYNILFADGHVVTTRVLPPSIVAKQQACLESVRRRLERAG